MQRTLVAALSSCVDCTNRREARRFLQGLSCDELRYIAEFMGSCLLESPGQAHVTRNQLAAGIAWFESCREAAAKGPQAQDHKMILLLEYLCRTGLTQFSLAARAGQV